MKNYKSIIKKPINLDLTKLINNSIFSKIIIISFLLCLNSCNTPAKQKTTIEHIKSELKKELEPKTLNMVTKIPYSINNLLIPKIYNKELNNFDESNQLYRKFNITADNIEAKEFFLALVNNTPVNIVVHPEVQGNISLSLKNVTVNETLEEVQKIYGFGFESSEQSIRIFPVALQTKVFKVNYLDLIRSGNSGTNINFSSISNSSNNSGGSSGGNGNNSGGNNGNSGNSNSNSNNNSGNNNNNSGNGAGQNNQSSGSSVSTSHSTNVWEQLKTTLEAMLGIDHKSMLNPTQQKKGPSKNVAVSPTTGMIIVTAYPNELEKIEQFLNTAESTLNRQVMLEAKVLEVDLKDGYRSGINWSLLNQHMNINQMGNTASGNEEEISNNSNPNSSSVNQFNAIDLINSGINRTAPNLISNQLTPFGGLFTLGMNYRKLAAFVELLSAQGNVQVLSSPRITTSNNQKALIKVGKDQYYITGVTNNQATTTAPGVQPANSQSVTLAPFFSGIALDVTPQIGEDDITLHIHPIISDVNGDPTTLPGYKEEVNLATSSVRESDSIIRAKNGQLIIIGGLMKDKTAEIITGVPFFKDFPFIGNLFRHTRQQAAKSELVILLRPIILDDYKIKNQIQKSYKRINDLDRGFHFGGGNTWYGNLGESKE